MAWQRSREELLEAFHVQVRAIESSCDAYDRGEKWEALRLATSICTLVHDNGKNYKSILAQLGVRGSLRFFASNRKTNPNNVMRETLLVSVNIQNDTAEYVPNHGLWDYAPRELQFHEWWGEDIIFREGQFTLTRKKLVFALRNKEGGAHLDERLNDSNYLRLSRHQFSMPHISTSAAPDPQVLLGAELASMRQIAWEVRATLRTCGSNEIRARMQ
jgi:hypothetical protein